METQTASFAQTCSIEHSVEYSNQGSQKDEKKGQKENDKKDDQEKRDRSDTMDRMLG